MERLEKSYEKHAGKTLLFVKLAPLFATPGLVAAGIARVPIKKYTLWSFIVTAPSSLFYLIVGYYFGAAYNKVVEFANYGSYILAMAIVVFITLSYLQKKYGKKLAEKIEEG
jgi:membrane protein DedA with SNARE-associated domain